MQLVLELVAEAVLATAAVGGLARLARLAASARPSRPPRPARPERRGARRLGRDPRDPAVAVVTARRAVARRDARPVPAGARPAGGRRPPASRPDRRAEGGGLAGDGASGRPPGDRRARRVGLADALESQADGVARRRSGPRRGRCPIVFAVAAPDAARLSLARWLLGSSERWPQQTYLTVMGLDPRGRLLAPRDERVMMEVRYRSPADRAATATAGRSAVAASRSSSVASPEHPSRPREVAAPRTHREERDPLGDDGRNRSPCGSVTSFPPSSTSSSFELIGGDDWLGPITSSASTVPHWSATKLRVKEPGTADPDFRTIDDAGQHLLFLPDTEIELTLVGSEPLSTAQMKIHPGSPPDLKRIDDRSFIARWTLRRGRHSGDHPRPRRRPG